MSDYKVGDKVSYGGKMHYVRKVKDGELWIRNASHMPVTRIHPDKVSAWQKKEKPSSASRGTCQICGGNYGTKMGNIAHHGYRRPGGWQTASCEGAKHLPYEKSRDILGDHIEGLHQSHKFHSEKAEHHKKDHGEPVDKIEHYRDAFGNKAQKVVTYHPDHPAYGMNKRDVQQHHNYQTKLYANAIEHQTKRYNDWKKLDEVKRSVGRATKLGSYLAKRWEKRGSYKEFIDHKGWEDNDQIDKLIDAGVPTDGKSWDNAKPRKVKIADLKPSQRGVEFRQFEFKANAKSRRLREPINVVKHDGEHHIWDGHHRVMGNKLLGNKHINARVYDLDKEEFSENVVRDDDRAMKLLKYLNKRRNKNSPDKKTDITYKDLSGKTLLDRYSHRVEWSGNVEPKDIPIHKIIPGQSGTKWSAPDDVVHRKLNDTKPVDVVKHPHEDKYIVYNGHHRVDAHRIKGKKTIKGHVGSINEKKRTDDQILDFVKKLNKRSEKNGIKNSGEKHDSNFAFSHRYKDWPEKQEPKDIYDYDLASGIKKAKQKKPRRVSLKGIIHTQPGVGFHAPEEVIKQKISDDKPIEIVRHKGKKYLWDGHHRDFIARARGEKIVKAHVVDTSKLEKWKV